MIRRMPARRLARSTAGAAVSILLLTAGCGEVAAPTTPSGKVDPGPAERVLRAYLDDDRCDLLSDRLATSIAPNPDDGRTLCARGQEPVDMLVRRGQYEVTDAEIIDGDGLFTIKLDDGGTRDYVLKPGGDDKFQIDQVTVHTAAQYGEPLRLQARAIPQAPPVDARITVDSLERIPEKKLSDDEYVSNFSQYWKAHVTVKSRSKADEDLPVIAFLLQQKQGVTISQAQIPFSDIGGLLPSKLKPGQKVSGYVFFVVPNDKRAKPAAVVYQYGNDDQGAKLVWTKDKPAAS
jgi:hypothetical protein